MATTLRASGSLTATMRAKVTASMTMPRMANRRIEPRPPPRWVSRSRPKPRSIPRPTAAAVTDAARATSAVRATSGPMSGPAARPRLRRNNRYPHSAPATNPSPLAAPRYPATRSGSSVRCGAATEPMTLTAVITMIISVGVQASWRA
ncbi:Uncharacterised protein [Mycobacteroides abscessus subsp. abscessus]|nr:Uncharacterised protein [Mycobacteroides abscessus subsp. abscessus]